MSELAEKERRIQDFLAKAELDAVAFSLQSNFAWATCGGDNHVATASDLGVATALFTRSGRKYVICENIEAPRIQAEEIADLGFELESFHWYEGKLADTIRRLGGERIGSDTGIGGTRNIDSDFAPYRYSLTPPEIERYRRLGRGTAECMALACREVRPGMTEHEIAAALNVRLIALGITPNVTLIATDERIARYRHPIPTEKKLEKCAMLVTGAKRWGLIVSMTRLVHFGRISDDLRRKHEAVAKADAAFITNTRPGARVGDIVQKAIQTYADTGFAEEWKLHHQGGATGYRGRDYRATSESADVVLENQAFAWNPSITGTKSEDTIVASSGGVEIISEIPDWPMVEVEFEGQALKRPDILQV